MFLTQENSFSSADLLNYCLLCCCCSALISFSHAASAYLLTGPSPVRSVPMTTSLDCGIRVKNGLNETITNSNHSHGEGHREGGRNNSGGGKNKKQNNKQNKETRLLQWTMSSLCFSQEGKREFSRIESICISFCCCVWAAELICNEIHIEREDNAQNTTEKVGKKKTNQISKDTGNVAHK